MSSDPKVSRIIATGLVATVVVGVAIVGALGLQEKPIPAELLFIVVPILTYLAPSPLSQNTGPVDVNVQNRGEGPPQRVIIDNPPSDPALVAPVPPPAPRPRRKRPAPDPEDAA